MDQLRPNLRPPSHREKIIESYRFALLARVAVQVVARSRKFPSLASDGFYWREFAGTDARTAASCECQRGRAAERFQRETALVAPIGWRRNAAVRGRLATQFQRPCTPLPSALDSVYPVP